MITNASYGVCPDCGAAIIPEWKHICPAKPGSTNLSYKGFVCPDCHAWVPNGTLHICPPDPQTVLLKEIIELLARIAEKLGA